VIELGQHPRGVVLAVRAQPRARQARIVGEHGTRVKVAVTQPPQDGKANDAVIEVLCEQLELKRGQVLILSGESSRDKRFLLMGLTPEELRQRLDRILTAT
jgi:uncharacterized protein (TIGR00251 family)